MEFPLLTKALPKSIEKLNSVEYILFEPYEEAFIKILILFLLLKSSLLLASPYKANSIVKFDGIVWSFSFMSKTEMLVTIRKGELYYFNIKTNEKKKLNIPLKITAEGQSGLLDVHYREVDKTTYVYFTYTEKYNGVLTTALGRGVYKDKKVTKVETLFRAKVIGDSTRHFGSRLIFKDNSIFMTIGDRGERKYAQNLSYHNGKILKLTMEGKASSDNPFINDTKALPEIWSLGHRNPQGIDLDPVSGSIYSVEFGPRGGDELNLIGKGKNYGWPVITYGKEYWGPKIGTTKKKGMEQPVAYWVPSISPSGIAFYTSNKLSLWINDLFLACLGEEHLRRIKIKNGKIIEQEVLFSKLEERIRHVRSAPDGLLYFSTDSGQIYKVHDK